MAQADPFWSVAEQVQPPCQRGLPDFQGFRAMLRRPCGKDCRVKGVMLTTP
jgi:hypothetical protein